MSENLTIKQFINVHISVMEEYYEMAYAVLSNYPFTGMEEKLDEIVVTFEKKDWNDEIRSEMMADLSSLINNVSITKEEVVADKNWNEEWEKHIEPIIVNERIAITPEWHKDKVTQPVKIIINPKMSFGTGHHATTRLVCKLMEKHLKPGSFWVDAGTGTGILAILAVMLGARSVFAFDNNEWSIDNANENIRLNNVQDKVEIGTADIDSINIPPADGIAANLFINLVIPSFPKFFNSLKDSKGNLLVSGILKYDHDEVVEAGKKAGFEHVETLYEDEWVGIHFRIKNYEL